MFFALTCWEDVTSQQKSNINSWIQISNETNVTYTGRWTTTNLPVANVKAAWQPSVSPVIPASPPPSSSFFRRVWSNRRPVTSFSPHILTLNGPQTVVVVLSVGGHTAATVMLLLHPPPSPPSRPVHYVSSALLPVFHLLLFHPPRCILQSCKRACERVSSPASNVQ